MEDLRRQWRKLLADTWIIDPESVCRGQLLEVEVDLEADPIFRLASIINTLWELLAKNKSLVDGALVGQLGQMRSIAEVLEGLLVGLVPIRGKIVDYDVVTVEERDVLVHKRILNRLEIGARPQAHPVYLVGVAERDLFWKDIRRILFSNARFTVFCRVARTGLVKQWRPVKVADVLAGIVPNFDELITEFGWRAEQAMTATDGTTRQSHGGSVELGVAMLTTYIERLVEHHGGSIDPVEVNVMVRDCIVERDWFESVDRRRPVFWEVTRRADEVLGKQTDAEVACSLRQGVVREAMLVRDKNLWSSTGAQERTTRCAKSSSASSRYLDAEVIAIYW